MRNEKIGFKIREHTLQRTPYLLVVGDREVENRSVALRTRSGVDLGGRRIIKKKKRFEAEVTQRA